MTDRTEARTRPPLDAADGQFGDAPSIRPLHDRTNDNTHVHAGVAKSFVAIHTFMFAVLIATFARDGETLFMIAICAFYFAMYVGTPFVMNRAAGRRLDDRSSWSAFLEDPFETFTGSVSGREAWLQICLVPLAVTIALTAICLIIIGARMA